MTLNRHDTLWTGLRGVGLLFLCKAILLLPALVCMFRMKETLYGSRDVVDMLPHVALGISGLVTYVAIYTLAAATFFLVPVRRSASPA
jgi:hypothetical protein